MSLKTIGQYEKYKVTQESELECEVCYKTINGWTTGDVDTNQLKKMKRDHRKECK